MAAATKVKRQLFGEYWLEGEIAILFADENAGKTILGYDIALAIASNVTHWPYTLCEARQPVFYFDFEMDKTQFGLRYPAGAVDMDDVKRATLGAGQLVSDPDTFLDALEETVKQPNAPKVVIVDNLSCILGNASGRAAINFLARLKSIKAMYGLSVLLIGHTKKRNPTKPISSNDLAGSKMLPNLADSMFALGKSAKRAGAAYLKHIKARSTTKQDLVAELTIVSEPYLHLKFDVFNEESEHLQKVGQRGRKKFDGEIIQRVYELSDAGASCRDIQRETGVSRSRVSELLKKRSEAQWSITATVPPTPTPLPPPPPLPSAAIVPPPPPTKGTPAPN